MTSHSSSINRPRPLPRVGNYVRVISHVRLPEGWYRVVAVDYSRRFVIVECDPTTTGAGKFRSFKDKLPGYVFRTDDNEEGHFKSVRPKHQLGWWYVTQIYDFRTAKEHMYALDLERRLEEDAPRQKPLFEEKVGGHS